MKKVTKPKKVVSPQEKEARSKRGKNNKVKGATYERKVAGLFTEAYNKFKLSLRRTPKSGGFAKEENNEFICGDLTCLNTDILFKLHLECKDCKVLHMLDWIKQASSDCVNGKIPCIVFRLSKKNHNISGNYITLPLDKFFEIVSGEAIIKDRR